MFVPHCTVIDSAIGQFAPSRNDSNRTGRARVLGCSCSRRPAQPPIKKHRNYSILPHLFCCGHTHALATATHGPAGIVPSGRAGDESLPPDISHWDNHWLITIAPFDRTRSVRKRRQLIIPVRASPPLGGTHSARSDTPRTPLVFSVATLLDALKMIGFDERCSMFAASCSPRVRLASLPSRPSPARRPCLAISVQSSLTCANVPSDSNREHFQPNSIESTANALRARDASC